MVGALRDPDLARDVGRRAQQLADTKYSDEAFIEKTKQACQWLFARA
jgi:hypothetical protein